MAQVQISAKEQSVDSPAVPRASQTGLGVRSGRLDQGQTWAASALLDWSLRCCLCRRPVPRADLVYALDGEWGRRYHGLRGRLSCRQCVTNYEFACDLDLLSHLDPHLATEPPIDDPQLQCNSWRHIVDRGPLKAMLREYPTAAVQQGARQYIEFLVRRHQLSATTMAKVHRALGTDPGMLHDFVLVLDQRPSSEQRRALYRKHPECRIDGERLTNAMLAPSLEQAVARMHSDLLHVGWSGTVLSVLPVDG